jgi:hypothetical protein
VTLYDIDDLDAARADYARLTAPSLDDHFPNLAARASRRLEVAANARDWDAYTAALAPAVEYHDRRTGLAVELIGDDARAVWRAMFDVDELRLDNEVIATRGERLALVLAVAVLRDGEVGTAQSAGLGVAETDAELVTRYVAFDPDDMTAALDELDARFAALGGSPLMATMRHSFDARDWDTFASVLTEDCTISDFRTAGWGLVDREVFVDYQRSVVDLADDAHLWVDHARERGNVGISTGRALGTRDGGSWEIAFVTVGVTNDDGRTQHFETYELGDMAVAIARFHELVAEDEAEPIENAAWRAVGAQARAVDEHSWEAFAATLTPDFEQDDRRSVIGRIARGPDALAVVQTIFAFDDMRLEETLLATRGDRLALVRTTATFRYGVELTPAEVVCLNVNQVNEHGLITHSLLFDNDDAQAAQDELEARYLALVGLEPRPNRALESMERAMRAFECRNWDAFSAGFHPDAILDDRRRGFSVYLTGDDAISSARVMFDMAEATWRCGPVAAAGDRVAVVQYEIWGTDGAVGEIEVQTLTVVEVDGNGRIVRQVSFDVDDRVKAEAEMHALAAALDTESASAADPLAIRRNLAVRSVEQPSWTLLAALADNLCLHATPEELVLHEVDETGNVTVRLVFGQDRRAAADEIARRYNTQMGFPPSAVRMSNALNAHDLGAMRECMADSCAVEDHRRLRVAHLSGPDEHIAMLASALALAPDYLVEVLRDVAVEPWGNVIVARSSGTATDGGPFESTYVALSVWDSTGRAVRLGVYEPEDADAAIERLRALCSVAR